MESIQSGSLIDHIIKEHGQQLEAVLHDFGIDEKPSREVVASAYKQFGSEFLKALNDEVGSNQKEQFDGKNKQTGENKKGLLTKLVVGILLIMGVIYLVKRGQ